MTGGLASHPAAAIIDSAQDPGGIVNFDHVTVGVVERKQGDEIQPLFAILLLYLAKLSLHHNTTH